ncbi:ribonucleotide reductase subunit alpha [Jeongeupia sp. USM3]|uniref:ribonucleotide reductase subunit alpha n=1 Tax=Jeongeupia sp. USM3 TaxID=1906741 RepID=UPI00089E037B|nr:ribonucleotide reductase subunit alpha [Jeongeupia sp. USM3]AOY02060.1 ribonucleotide reductase subunit alpha [Jeongeupia sp. USM3]
MQIASFADFLIAASQQPEPQRLLFVFTRAELPADATAEEKARFERGEGGTLEPVMCVDKLPSEIADFAQLKAESAQIPQSWDIGFVASLGGRAGRAPGSDEAGEPLERMVGMIKQGHVGQFLAFDRNGEMLQFG